ncbi:MAG: ABC transporter ATP-binding protein [Promethearchaeota archaeon]
MSEAIIKRTNGSQAEFLSNEREDDDPLIKEYVIYVKDLAKIFLSKKKKEKIYALRGITFGIKKGEIFGLLGPNGAGKTTTMRIIMGILKPTLGQTYIFGRSTQNLGDRIRKQIGYLTENHGNYENLTLYQNLKFFGNFYDIENLEERIDAVLKELEIYDRKNMKIGKFSKGLKQRAAIARVLLPNPEILFFDEPTAGLDPEAARNLRNLIKALKSENRTILINSHNLDEVQRVCDRVGILNSGRIVRIGSPEELSEQIFKSQELNITLRLTGDIKTSQDLNNFINKIRNTLKISESINKIVIDPGYLLNFMESSDYHKGQLTFRVIVKDINEVTPEIVEKLVNNGLKVLEIRRNVHSLEDVYLKLIKEHESQE